MPIRNDDKDAVNIYKGFTLKYTAEYAENDTTMCVNPDGENVKRTVTIQALCNKGATTGAWTEVELNNDCDLVYQYTGDEACKFYDVDISKYFSGLTKFAGAISILLGLVLTFVGSKFILIVFGLLVFLLSQVIMWGILYNTHMFKPEEVEDKKGLILGLGVVVFALGGVGSYYMSRFADKFAVPLISGWCGGIVSFMLIGGIKMPGAAKLVIIAMVAGATVYYSYKVQRFVKSAGTAMIGAFILFNGIGKYVGGYPSIMSAQSEGEAEDAAIEKLNSNAGAMALFYLGGTVAFTILGTWFQLTYIQKVKEDEDDFMNKEDA